MSGEGREAVGEGPVEEVGVEAGRGRARGRQEPPLDARAGLGRDRAEARRTIVRS